MHSQGKRGEILFSKNYKLISLKKKGEHLICF